MRTTRLISFVLQMVKLLLNKGANLSAIDKKERQPIHCAAYLGEYASLSCQCFTSQARCKIAISFPVFCGKFGSGK